MRTSVRLIEIIKLLAYALVFVVIIDPSGEMLGIKDVVFLLTFLSFSLGVIIYYKYHVERDSLFIIGLFIALPLLSLIISFPFSNPILFSAWFAFFKSHLFILLLLVLVNFRIDVMRVFRAATLIVALISIISYLSLIYFEELHISLYKFFVIQTENARFSANRSFIGFNIHSMFYKTSPLLLISLPFFIRKISIDGNISLRFLLFSSICFLGLMATGTRASMLGGILIILIHIFRFFYLKVSKSFSLLVIIIGFIASVLLISILISDSEEPSNKIKFAHIDSYLSEFSKAKTIIIGQGVGSQFFTKGWNEMVTHTELTYLDIYRMYGLFMGTLFIGLILYPAVHLLIKGRGDYRAFGLGYSIYLPIAGTNPLLISSTGFLVIVLAYWYTIKLLKSND